MKKQQWTLQQWRGLRGYSRRELGEKVGVSRNTILDWEARGEPYTLEQVRKLEEALDIKWADDICMPERLR